MFKNMKIEINSEQPLDKVVKELERLGYVKDKLFWDNRLNPTFVCAWEDEALTDSQAAKSTDSHLSKYKNTTLAQLKQMENIMQNRSSELGKLYNLKQANKHLDKLVFNVQSSVEYNIVCGYTLPFNIELKKEFDINEQEIIYIKEELNKRGVVLGEVITQMYKHIITVDDLL